MHAVLEIWSVDAQAQHSARDPTVGEDICTRDE